MPPQTVRGLQLVRHEALQHTRGVALSLPYKRGQVARELVEYVERLTGSENNLGARQRRGVDVRVPTACQWAPTRAE
eukprot:1244246-Rhodomonas_salina.1